MSRLDRRLSIVLAVLGIVLVFAGVGAVVANGRVNQGAAVMLLGGLALLIGYAVLSPEAVRDLVVSRQARFGTLAVLITAVFVGVLVLGNVIVSRSDRSWDLTKAKLNTLSPKTIKVVRSLDADVYFIGFFQQNQQDSHAQLEDLLRLYQLQSDHVKIRFEDPQVDLSEVQQFGVQIPGTLVVRYRDRTELLTLTQQTEQDVTGTLIKLRQNRTPVVCWVTGERERNPDDAGENTGFTKSIDLLKKNNYGVKPLLLSQAPGVPADCDVVAVMGPQQRLSTATQDNLTRYIGAGGKLLLAVDPWLDADVLASINAVLKPYGVRFTGGLVVDPNQSAQNNPTIPVVVQYGRSPITQNLSNLPSFFYQPTSLTGDAPGDVDAVKLASTTAQSYEIASPRKEVTTKKPEDRTGSATIMETLEQKQAGGKRMRVVLVGTPLFASNGPITQALANNQLFTGSIDWLAEQDQLISIPPKDVQSVPVAYTSEEQAWNIVLTLLLIPLLIAGGGVLVWVRRRAS